jgi:hypothetical protein
MKLIAHYFRAELLWNFHLLFSTELVQFVTRAFPPKTDMWPLKPLRRGVHKDQFWQGHLP